MKLNYCTECGAPLSQQTLTDYICTNNHPYWNNPRVAVSILIRDGNKLLVAKRGAQPHKAKYDFPGGFLEYNEDAQTAAKREILEETDLTIDKLQLIYSHTHEYDINTSVCDLVFIANKWSGKPKPHDDVAALVWVKFNVIDSSAFAWKYPGLVDTLTKIP